MRKKILVSIATILVVALLAVTLAACIPSTPEKAKANLEDAGYIALAYDASEMAKETDNYEGLTGGVVATKGEISLTSVNFEMIFILYFDSASSAKEVWDEVKADYEKKDGYVVKRQGKIIYAGTEQAVKDAK